MTNNKIKIDFEKLFNVKRNEIKFVRLLFLYSFFQGLALSLFFVASNAIFLGRFEATKLPYVYIYSGVVLIILGLGHSTLDQKLSIKKVLQTTVLFLFISTFFLRFGLENSDAVWLIFLVAIWYRASNLLSNVSFWSLTSQLFDVRQSKRLFGIISSGDVIARLLGYLTIPALSGIVQNKDYIFVASIAFLICYFFLNKVLSVVESTDFSAPKQKNTGEKNENLIKKYLSSDFIILLSILSFLSIIAFTIIDFSFMSNLKARYSSGEKLAEVLGLFYGFSKGVTILVKMFFTGRIIDKLGVKFSLLFLPVLFLVLTTGIIIFNLFSGENAYLIWLFGTMMLFQEIFRYSLHEPVFFSLFQPLAKSLRTFGHSIVNGFLNPFAIGISGAIILLMIFLFQGIDLSVVSYILFFILIAWLIVIFVSNKEYVRQLKNALKKRFFGGTEINLKGKAILDFLTEKLDSKYPEEVIYSLDLLVKSDGGDLSEIYKKVLKNESEEVKLYAISKIEENNYSVLKEEIFKLIDESDSLKIKEAAIKTFSVIDENAVDKTLLLLDNDNIIIKKGAITGLLKSGSLEGIVLAGQQLLQLIQSEIIENQIIGAEIIGELKIKNFYKPVIEFFNQDDIELKKAAIISSGKIKNERFLPYLIEFLSVRELRETSIRALMDFENDAISFIQNIISGKELQECSISKLHSFCRIASGIHTKESIELLLSFMEFPFVKVRYEAILSLKKLQYAAHENEEKIKEIFYQQFNLAAWLYISWYNFRESKAPEFIKALYLEYNIVKENLFNILALIYDSKAIFEAKEGLLSPISENRANALEIIDTLVGSRFSSRFFVLLDDIPDPERKEKLIQYCEHDIENISEIVKRVIIEKDKNFNRWTQITAINAVEIYRLYKFSPEIFKYIDNPSKILNQTAIFCLKSLISDKEIYDFILKSDIDIKKVRKVMSYEESENNLQEIEKVIILKSTSLFTETPENILVDIANILEAESYEANTTIFSKGDTGTCMYIINEGNIKIHDENTIFAKLSNRNFFGELALLDPEPRSASATTITDSLLLKLEQDAFFELMTERAEMAKGILKVLTRRIRSMNDQLIELKSK